MIIESLTISWRDNFREIKLWKLSMSYASPPARSACLRCR
jgi:hypothetical protein